MKNQGRLSRKLRGKLYRDNKKNIALILAFLLIILVVGNYRLESLKNFVSRNLPGKSGLKELSQLAGSMVVDIDRSFFLDDSTRVGQDLLLPDGRSVMSMTQPWPAALPLVIYAEKIEREAGSRGFSCDCVESPRDKILTCMIKSDDYIVLALNVESSANTYLRGRSVGFVLDDLGGLIGRDLIRILDSGISFAYYGRIDVYPQKDMKKILESRQIGSILEIAADKSGLTEISRLAGRRKGRRGRKSGSASDDDIASELFGLHPNLFAFYFRRTEKTDREFVEAVLKSAENEDINYLLTDSLPDKIDSLAYSIGLRIVRIPDPINIKENTGENRFSPILDDLIYSGEAKRIDLLLSGDNQNIGALIKFQGQCDRLGVKLLNYKELFESIESL